MVTFGRGGWTWKDIYNMPVYLRMFYATEFSLTMEKERSPSSTNSSAPNKITPPPFVKS